MIPTAEHNLPTELQFPSFLTQLKAPPASEDPMRFAEEQQRASPTSIATNVTDNTPTTSQPLPSFTLDQQSTNCYGTNHLPLRQAPHSFATLTGYYTQQGFSSRDPPSTSTTPSWNASTYSPETPMVLGDYIFPQHPPLQPPLHPLVLQHSEPRLNDDDLAMDAQMLRKALQEMPASQLSSVHAHASDPTVSRGPQTPGLQLLFASPTHSTEMNGTALQSQALGFYTNAMDMATPPADMLLTMSQTQSAINAAPITPLFPSAQMFDRAVLSNTLPPLPPNAMISMSGAYDSLAATVVPPPTLVRKKHTSATRVCKVEGCTKGIRSRGLCKAHGGGRRCTTPGCTTSDQGGGHCVLHGGGRRCQIEGCKKSAQWRGVCKMHGGARRCRYGQCTKNGQVKQGYCRMHHNLLTAQRQQQQGKGQVQAQQLQ